MWRETSDVKYRYPTLWRVFCKRLQERRPRAEARSPFDMLGSTVLVIISDFERYAFDYILLIAGSSAGRATD